MRPRLRQLVPVVLALTLALFVGATAAPEPASAGCNWWMLCVDEAVEEVVGTGQSMWYAFTGQAYVDMAQDNAACGGCLDATYRAWSDGFAVLDTFFECVGAFEPTGAVSAFLAVNDVTVEATAADTTAEYVLPTAGEEAVAWAADNPERFQAIVGKVSLQLAPRLGRAVPVVNRAVALVTIADGLETCGSLFSYGDEGDGPDATPTPAAPTTTVPVPTGTTIPRFDADEVADVPGGRFSSTCDGPYPPTPCRPAGR